MDIDALDFLNGKRGFSSDMCSSVCGAEEVSKSLFVSLDLVVQLDQEGYLNHVKVGHCSF